MFDKNPEPSPLRHRVVAASGVDTAIGMIEGVTVEFMAAVGRQ